MTSELFQMEQVALVSMPASSSAVIFCMTEVVGRARASMCETWWHWAMERRWPVRELTGRVSSGGRATAGRPVFVEA